MFRLCPVNCLNHNLCRVRLLTPAGECYAFPPAVAVAVVAFSHFQTVDAISYDHNSCPQMLVVVWYAQAGAEYSDKPHGIEKGSTRAAWNLIYPNQH